MNNQELQIDQIKTNEKLITNIDIGIDIDSVMEVLIPRNSILPVLFECEIVINNNSIFSLYAGNRFYVKDNKNIGNYELPFKKSYYFKLNLNEENILKVYIDDEQVDTIFCNDFNIEINNIEIEKTDNELRQLRYAKNDFIEYIKSSLSSIEELNMDNQKKDFLIDKLKWANQILEVDDVSSSEYRLALREIESIVNPILEPYMNTPMINEYVF